jgi:hypothetical protein
VNAQPGNSSVRLFQARTRELELANIWESCPNPSRKTHVTGKGFEKRRFLAGPFSQQSQHLENKIGLAMGRGIELSPLNHLPDRLGSPT